MAAKRRVKRGSPKRVKKIPPLRRVFFDPQTGKRLSGFNVMTPTGLVLEIPEGWKHWKKGNV